MMTMTELIQGSEELEEAAMGGWGLIEGGLSCLELFKQRAGKDQTPGNETRMKYCSTSKEFGDELQALKI